jgi:hypothetical protein
MKIVGAVQNFGINTGVAALLDSYSLVGFGANLLTDKVEMMMIQWDL